MKLASTHKIDTLEKAITECLKQAECPVVHRFVPGMYIRETTIPAGTVGVSMEHKTEHPFVITKGRVRVYSDNESFVIYEAPYTGITLPGTRRILMAEEETVWTTFHVTNHTDLDSIAKDILAPHDNPLIEEQDKNQWRLQSKTLITE